MPALRNRLQHSSAANGHQKQPLQNGFSADEAQILKKKLISAQEEEYNANNNSLQQTNHQEDTRIEQDEFEDTSTMGAHAKMNTDEPPVLVFPNQRGTSSIGKSVNGQFAAALLRLQVDLDATCKRLSGLETRLDSAISKTQTRETQEKAREAAAKKRSNLFTKDNVYTLIYLSWPVVVYMTMRAIERRSLASK